MQCHLNVKFVHNEVILLHLNIYYNRLILDTRKVYCKIASFFCYKPPWCHIYIYIYIYIYSNFTAITWHVTFMWDLKPYDRCVACIVLAPYRLSVWHCHPVSNFSFGFVPASVRNRYTCRMNVIGAWCTNHVALFKYQLWKLPQPADTMICDVILQYIFIPLSLIRRYVWLPPP